MSAEALKKTRDVVDYIAFMVNEFAAAHQLTATQSFEYMKRYGAISFLDEFYDVEHCENPAVTLRDINQLCHREGGLL